MRYPKGLVEKLNTIYSRQDLDNHYKKAECLTFSGGGIYPKRGPQNLILLNSMLILTTRLQLME